MLPFSWQSFIRSALLPIAMAVHLYKYGSSREEFKAFHSHTSPSIEINHQSAVQSIDPSLGDPAACLHA